MTNRALDSKNARTITTKYPNDEEMIKSFVNKRELMGIPSKQAATISVNTELT